MSAQASSQGRYPVWLTPDLFPTHNSWRRMRTRCNWPSCKDYRWYGGRGITVCERWNSFANFLADMGPRAPELSLERINNDGNYEPGNCRWATRAEQLRNKRPGGGWGNRPPSESDRYGLRSLEIGDVAIIPFERPTQVRGSADKIAKTKGRRFSIKKLPENRYFVLRTA